MDEGTTNRGVIHVTPGSVHAVIATWPIPGSLSLSREIAMLKATYLYADSALVLSPTAIYLAETNLGLKDVDDAELLASFPDGDTKQNTPPGVLANAIREYLAGQYLIEYGVSEYCALLELEGVSGCNMRHVDAPCLHKRMEVHLTETLEQAPLIPGFTESDSDAARRVLAQHDNRWSSSSAELSLSNQLLQSLPSFAILSPAEIADVRDEMSDPLTRYRSAVAFLSHTLSDVDFEPTNRDIHALWREYVAPDLLEIRALFSESSFLRQLGNKSIRDLKGLLLAGSVAFGISRLADVDAMAQAVAGVVGSVGSVTANALVGRREARAEAQRHRFFYLHRVSEVAERAGRERHSPALCSHVAGGPFDPTH